MIPVVDLFAGPGGLGEGFSMLKDGNGNPVFENVLSIEKDSTAVTTLKVRHFFRMFADGNVPKQYYDILSGDIVFDQLRAQFKKDFDHIDKIVLQRTLGVDSDEEIASRIRNAIDGEDMWILVGGPPCQAYSLAGRSRMKNDPNFEDDHRHTLYREYLRVIADHKPAIFVMENVKGLISAKLKGNSVARQIIDDLRSPSRALHLLDNLAYDLYSMVDDGTEPNSFLVRSEEYGIPQKRHRMFFVGVRSDLRVKPGKLAPQISVTVEEAIGSLPRIRSGLSGRIDSFKAWVSEVRKVTRVKHYAIDDFQEKVSRVINALINDLDHPTARKSIDYDYGKSNNKLKARLWDPRIQLLPDHDSRSHMSSDLRRYAYAAKFAELYVHSPRLHEFPFDLLPDHKNIGIDPTSTMFNDRFRVQIAGSCSSTITSHISKDGHYFIHYDPAQARSMSVREVARLQTFSDNYYFHGGRTSKFHQVGNAVPPLLAEQIAGVLAEALGQV